MRLLVFALVAVSVLGHGLEADRTAGKSNGMGVEGQERGGGRGVKHISPALFKLSGLDFTRAGDLLGNGSQRRKGGGGAKGGGFKGGSSSGSKSSGSSSSGGGGSLGKSSYSNPAPVSSSTKTGTYRTSTSTGQYARPGTTTTKTRPTTASAAVAASNFRASPVSYQSYNSRSSYGVRPFYLYAAVIVASSSSRGRNRQCTDNTFRFGGSCKRCSSGACPIGQFRSVCDPYNDAYCTPCTGLPANSYWITPGNGDNCQYESCSAESPCELCPTAAGCPEVSSLASDPATVSFFMEVPVSKAEWDGGISSRMREAIASAGSSAGVSKNSVIIAAADEDTLPAADVAAGSERRQATTSARRLLQTTTTTTPTPTTTPIPTTTTSTTTTTTTTPAPVTTPAPASDSCGVSAPEHDKFVNAVVEVNTNGALVNQVWDSLNEMAINRALSQQCIPPVLVGYFGSAPSASASIFLALSSALVAVFTSALHN